MKTRTKKFFFTLVAIILGLIAVLVLLEIFTGVLSSFTDPEKLRASVLKVDPKADFLIVCVGDSHVAGVEAPKNLDFPTQLEILLNTYDRNRLYKVVNLGHAGYNSTQAADRALEFVRRADKVPQLVLFCAGFNNCWNFSKADFLPEELRNRGMGKQFQYLLSNSHVFKFGRITLERLRQFSDKGSKYSKVHTKIVDTESPEEMKFLTAWIERDLEFLDKTLRSKNVRLVDLTYHNNIPWTNEAMLSLEAGKGIPCIDVRFFGYRSLEKQKGAGLVAAGSHPNKYGYAKIAELIRADLLRKKLIPEPSEPD